MWIWVGGNVGDAVEQSLYTVNMYYDHCLVKSSWPIAGQERLSKRAKLGTF